MKVGDVVRVMTMARTDAIGRVIEITAHGVYIVRLENWQGYHLDVECSVDELRRL